MHYTEHLFFCQNGLIISCVDGGVFNIRAILSQDIEPERVAIRDQQTYCGILFDDNNRKPLARLWFNTSQKYIGLFDFEERQEHKTPINKVNDIFQYADRLKATIVNYAE